MENMTNTEVQEEQKVQEKPTMTPEQMVATVLLSFKRGHDVDMNDFLVRRITEKLIRRGLLNKSVADGSIVISEYGIKVLKKLGIED